MRISDWSSDVCSSDLVCVDGKVPVAYPAFLNALGIAVPDHDIHQPFIDWARTRIDDPRQAALFDRMAARSGIAHRWSRSEEHTSELQSLMRISYAVFCLKKKNKKNTNIS